MKQRKKEVVAIIILPLLSAFLLLCEMGLMRSMEIGSLKNYFIHIPALVGGQILLFCLTYFLFSDLPKKVAGILFALSFVIFLCIWLFLVGFRHNLAALVTSGIFLAAQALICCGYKKIKTRGVLAAMLTVVFCAASCLAGYMPGELAVKERIKTAPLADFSQGFPCARPVKKLYVFEYASWDEEDVIFLKSVQGFLGIVSDEQFLEYYTYVPYEKSLTEERVRVIEKYYPDVEIEYTDSFDDALEMVCGKIKNYIYCDGKDEGSGLVALNLCNRFNAVCLSEKTLCYAQKYGWTEVFNTVGKDEDWLIGSEYFSALNKSLVFLARPERMVSDFSDYAIVGNCWMIARPRTLEKLEERLAYLDRNFIIIGGIGDFEERAVVSATSRYSGTFVFSSGMSNVAVLSSFRLENAAIAGVNTSSGVKKQTKKTSEEKVENKHTVCIMLSDGDNMRFTAGEALATDRLYGSERRGEDLSCNYGMSGACVLIAPIVLLSYYDQMYSSEDFVMQLGSIGYVFPSHWRDEEAFGKVTDLLVESMEKADINVVEIMDDDSFLGGIDFPHRFDRLKSQFDKYTCYEQIDGCLFIDFMGLYAGYKGEICWSNDKPVVSARYSLWSRQDNPLSTSLNEPDAIAAAINKASRDVTSEDSYSFIIVHVWSGLDENGDLVPRGDTMAGVERIISLLDDDVDVVTASEFIRRIKANVKR